MMEIELSPKAERQWSKLRSKHNIFSRIENALDEISTNPYIGKSLTGRLAGIRSYRVGEWRILYKIFKDKLVVLVVSIADRKEVYR